MGQRCVFPTIHLTILPLYQLKMMLRRRRSCALIRPEAAVRTLRALKRLAT
jgi:hypothetical protein